MDLKNVAKIATLKKLVSEMYSLMCSGKGDAPMGEGGVEAALGEASDGAGDAMAGAVETMAPTTKGAPMMSEDDIAAMKKADASPRVPPKPAKSMVVGREPPKPFPKAKGKK